MDGTMEVDRSESHVVHVHAFVPKAVLMTLPTIAAQMNLHQSLGSQGAPGETGQFVP